MEYVVRMIVVNEWVEYVVRMIGENEMGGLCGAYDRENEMGGVCGAYARFGGPNWTKTDQLELTGLLVRITLKQNGMQRAGQD